MNIDYDKFYTAIMVKDLDKALTFYIDETGWFYKEDGFGVDCAKLSSIGNDTIGIFLYEKEKYNVDEHETTLYFYTSNLDKEYAKFFDKEFHSGALLIDKDGIVNWPAGRYFTLLDPSGNTIAIRDSSGL